MQPQPGQLTSEKQVPRRSANRNSAERLNAQLGIREQAQGVKRKKLQKITLAEYSGVIDKLSSWRDDLFLVCEVFAQYSMGTGEVRITQDILLTSKSITYMKKGLADAFNHLKNIRIVKSVAGQPKTTRTSAGVLSPVFFHGTMLQELFATDNKSSGARLGKVGYTSQEAMTQYNQSPLYQNPSLQWFRRGYAASATVTVAIYMINADPENKIQHPQSKTNPRVQDNRFFITAPWLTELFSQPTLTIAVEGKGVKIVNGRQVEYKRKDKQKGIATLNTNPLTTTTSVLEGIFGGQRLSSSRMSNGRLTQLDTGVQRATDGGLILYNSLIQAIISLNSYRMNAANEGFDAFSKHLNTFRNRTDIIGLNQFLEFLGNQTPNPARELFNSQLENAIDVVVRAHNYGDPRPIDLRAVVLPVGLEQGATSFLQIVANYVNEGPQNAIKFWLALSYMVVKSTYDRTDGPKPLYSKRQLTDPQTGRRVTEVVGILQLEYTYIHAVNTNRKFSRQLQLQEQS